MRAAERKKFLFTKLEIGGSRRKSTPSARANHCNQQQKAPGEGGFVSGRLSILRFLRFRLLRFRSGQNLTRLGEAQFLALFLGALHLGGLDALLAERVGVAAE